MITRFNPPVPHLMALYAAGLPINKPLMMGGLRANATRQIFFTVTYGFYDADALIAALWVHEHDPLPGYEGRRVVECGLVGMGGLTARQRLGVARRCRLTLDRWAQCEGVDLYAFVRIGHEPGQRMARLMGFSPDETIEVFERWKRAGEPHGADGAGIVRRRRGLAADAREPGTGGGGSSAPAEPGAGTGGAD